MTRTHRIVLIVLAVAAAICIVVYGGVSAMLSRIATREVSKFLAELPEGKEQFSSSRLPGKAIPFSAKKNVRV